MKIFMLITALCVLTHASREQEEKMINLEDIESDTLRHETVGSAPVEQQKEDNQPPTQHVQVSYSHEPQEVFVTPMPGHRYAHPRESPAELRAQIYHLPKVHEAEQTYTVPAKQTLVQPIIGGSQPIHPILAPQPQYIYVQSPQAPQQYAPQAHSYVMLPYASQYTSHQTPVHVQQVQHPVLPQPHLPTAAPAVYTYHGPVQQQPTYQSVKSIDYSLPASVPNPVTPLQTAVDYKVNSPITIVPRKTLPSVSTTSFQQFYSPGLEYHYSEAVPVTKLTPQQSYSYQQAPAQAQSYHNNYVSQSPSYSYYHTGQSAAVNFNKPQSGGLLESYVPSSLTYARQQLQQPQFKNYYPAQYQQQNYQQQVNYQQQNYHQQSYQQLQPQSYQQPTHQQQYSPAQVQQQQQLFTPAHQPSYTPYPSPQAYNTIQYSVSLPPYDHKKRSTSKATATLSVKAPKSN